MKLFTKRERSTWRYWFAHVLAFNMTAVILNRWKPKYIFHDWEKPWLMMWWKDYKRVQKWHRTHRRHHLDYPYPHKIDWEAMIIDKECSRFTKESSPLTASEQFIKECNEGKFPDPFLREKYIHILNSMGL